MKSSYYFYLLQSVLTYQHLLLLHYPLCAEPDSVCVLLHKLSIPILLVSERRDRVQVIAGAIAIAVRGIEI